MLQNQAAGNHQLGNSIAWPVSLCPLRRDGTSKEKREECTVIKTVELSLDDAKKMAAAANAQAHKMGLRVVIAIVDSGGHTIYLERIDGTQKVSSLIAVEKARTAILFQRPSKAFEDTVAGGRVAVMTLPTVTTVEGGLPVVVDGQYIGAIGVSGAKSPEDSEIAKAGLDALTL
jgi:glc operon protein GlcG